MSDVKFSPFVPNGTVNVPPSKSDVHRAIICAAMANGVSRISPVAFQTILRQLSAVLKHLALTLYLKTMFSQLTAQICIKTKPLCLIAEKAAVH